MVDISSSKKRREDLLPGPFFVGLPQPEGSRQPRIKRVLILATVILLGLASWNAYNYQLIFQNGRYLKRKEDGTLGAVATEHALCSRIGLEILRKGGNAVDAAIASTLCVGVVASYHSGIGGGGFAVIRSGPGSYETVDFRESAPQSASERMFSKNPHESVFGGLAIGVPGELRGFEYMHRKYGTLPWKDLIEPAVNMARNGFVAGEDMERISNAAISDTPDNYDFLKLDPVWAIDFAPNGHRPRKGDIIFRRRYADTLEQIAAQGPNAFYKGPLAECLVRAVQAANGSLTLEDLGNYRVRHLLTSNITYRNHRLFSTVAPSSGAITLSALKIAEGFDDFFTPETTNLSTHRLIESMKFAFGQRLNLGDPAFVPNMEAYQADILSNKTAKANHDKIQDDHVLEIGEYNPTGYSPSPSHGTSHIVATDQSGLSVSLTTTVNLLYGSHIMVPETGVILNDVMNDFSIPDTSNEFGFPPSPANYIRPYKRPLSASTPVFVENASGELRLVLGAAGGSRIISSTIQNIIHVLDRNLSMAEALAEPRLHDQLLPEVTGFEPLFDRGVIEFLRERGHNVKEMPGTLSAVQGIIKLSNGTFDVASEPRQRDSGGFSV